MCVIKRLSIMALLLACTFAAGAQQRFSCDFKMTDNESGNVVFYGKAYVQDSCYRLETQAGEVCCNGTDRWIYTSSSDELVIQKNDVSFLNDIKVNKSADGTAVVVYSNFTITMTGITNASKPWPAEFFFIDPDSFGMDTIVTDLR